MKKKFTRMCSSGGLHGQSSANSRGRGVSGSQKGGRGTRPPFRAKVQHVDENEQDKVKDERNYDEE